MELTIIVHAYFPWGVAGQTVGRTDEWTDRTRILYELHRIIEALSGSPQ